MLGASTAALLDAVCGNLVHSALGGPCPKSIGPFLALQDAAFKALQTSLSSMVTDQQAAQSSLQELSQQLAKLATGGAKSSSGGGATVSQVCEACPSMWQERLSGNVLCCPVLNASFYSTYLPHLCRVMACRAVWPRSCKGSWPVCVHSCHSCGRYLSARMSSRCR